MRLNQSGSEVQRCPCSPSLAGKHMASISIRYYQGIIARVLRYDTGSVLRRRLGIFLDIIHVCIAIYL